MLMSTQTGLARPAGRASPDQSDCTVAVLLESDELGVHTLIKGNLEQFLGMYLVWIELDD